MANGTADKHEVKVDDTITFSCLRGFKWEDNSTEKERSYRCVSKGRDNVTIDGSPPDCIGQLTQIYRENDYSLPGMSERISALFVHLRKTSVIQCEQTF